MANIKFEDLYEEVLSIETAIKKIELDIETAQCDSLSKCTLENELSRATAAYSRLLNSDVDFKELDFTRIIDSMNRCMRCVNISI